MNVLILATEDCNHCLNLKHELNILGIKSEVKFAEDNPELVTKYSIRHSPNLIIGEEVIFRHIPTSNELKKYFEEHAKGGTQIMNI